MHITPFGRKDLFYPWKKLRLGVKSFLAQAPAFRAGLGLGVAWCRSGVWGSLHVHDSLSCAAGVSMTLGLPTVLQGQALTKQVSYGLFLQLRTQTPRLF